MSTTKVIKGQIKQWEEPIGVMNAKFTAAHSEVRESLNWEPATLYIGTGKLWTEEEVRAMTVDILRNTVFAAPDFRHEESKRIAAKHGLTL